MATGLKLRFYGDPCLRKVADRVADVGPAERLLIKELIQAMYAFEGSGLAATQVGINEQIFVADAGEGPFAVINPEVVKKSVEETVLEEGCLSLPGIRVGVRRPSGIRVRYQDETGRVMERDLTGLLAKVFQHESDHLFGRMIIDYASRADLEKYAPQLAKLEVKSGAIPEKG
jgi:peptide deformylase